MASSSSKKRKLLSLEERVHVVDKHEKGMSMKKLSEEYECGTTQIFNIIKNKDAIRDKWRSGKRADSRYIYKEREQKYPELNRRVRQFYDECFHKGLPVSGAHLKEHALQVSMELNLDDFQASQGWLQSWLKREGLSWSLLCGESGSVPQEVIEDYTRRIPTITEGYKPEDIFNMDESGLFYRSLPNRSYVQKGSKAHGWRKRKDRITMVLCVSASGEKLMPWIIGKSQNPRAFRGLQPHELNVIYKSNKKAWMTGKEFSDFVNALNNKMRVQNRNILLIVDNAPGHPNMELSNVKLHFLPPNATSCLQPLDAGIIQQVKCLYKKALVRHIRARLSECATAYEMLTSIDIHDAVQWIHTAWLQVTPETIVKCWNKCGFKFEESGEQEYNPVITEPPEFQELQVDGSWQDFIEMDASAETCNSQENMNIPEESTSSAKEETVEEDGQESDTEDIEPAATLQNMRQKLLLLKNYRQIACELSNTKMLHLVKQMQSVMEEEVLLMTQKSAKQTSIKDYFVKQEPLKGMSVSYE